MLASLRYRFNTFGALNFCHGLVRSLIALTVKQFVGKKAAQRLYRMGTLGSPGPSRRFLGRIRSLR